MKLNLLNIRYFLVVLFLFVVLTQITPVNALEWHNCCDVNIHEDKLIEVYHNYIQTEQCWGDQTFDECLGNYEKRVLDREVAGFDEFKKVLIADSINECNSKNKLNKERFGGSCEDVAFCEDVKAMYSGVWFEEESFKDPTYEKFQVKYQAYNLDTTLSKYRRSGSQYEQSFVLSNSRFNYLQPKQSVNKFQTIYDAAYAVAKDICITDLGISEKISVNSYLESNPDFLPCISKQIQLSKQEKDLYAFYTNWYSGGGDNYISGLAICEETLGFQNDIGIITFSGQSESVNCEESDMIDGCCPGFHKDMTFDVCCSSGFEGYKKEDGTILCAPAQEEDEINSVHIELSKQELILDGEDFIFATLTYSARTPVGDITPYADKNIFHGIIAESKTSQYSFLVEKISSKTDSQGKLKVKISLKNADINTLGTDIEDVKVQVYSLDQPANEQDDTFFTLSLGDGILIESIEIISNQKVWQNSPVKLKVKVNDPLHEKKMFTLESSTSFKINGNEDDFISYYTTTENEFEFTWFAPQISHEVKMDYVKRIADGLVKMGLVVAEDIGGNKLGKYLEDSKDVSLKFKNVNDVYNKMNLLVKTDIQATGANSLGQELIKTANEPYKYAQKGVNTVLWMEGTMGILGKPATPLLTTLKTGLTGINEWYDLVEDMEKVAKAEKITLDVPITISIEGLQTKSTDSMIKYIPVEGFEMVVSK